MIVVSGTSPLAALLTVDEADILLKLFAEVGGRIDPATREKLAFHGCGAFDTPPGNPSTVCHLTVGLHEPSCHRKRRAVAELFNRDECQ